MNQGQKRFARTRTRWIHLCQLFLMGCGIATAAPLTVGFDDLDASKGDVILDTISPYHGLIFINVTAYTNVPGFQGFNNGIVSSPNAAYSGGEVLAGVFVPVVGQIRAAAPFDFLGAYIGAGYYNNLAVTVQGLRGGAAQFSKTVTVNTQGAQPFSFGFSAIDELSFFASQTPQSSDPFGCGSQNCTQFTFDEMRFIAGVPQPPPSSVPEPSTAALLCISAAAFYLFRLKSGRKL